MKKNVGMTLLRTVKILLTFAMLSSLVACKTTNWPFNPIDKNKNFKSTTIAVISGDEHDADVKLAGYITERLIKKSTFRVMSQKEIASRVPGYPVSIVINTEVKEADEKPTWFPPSQNAKLNTIQAKLKVDYIFVV
jgi:hypothetical protein